MNYNQNFRVNFDMTMILQFYISEDLFGHHLNQILSKATTKLSP